jgi:hypothetical protein
MEEDEPEGIEVIVLLELSHRVKLGSAGVVKVTSSPPSQ